MALKQKLLQRQVQKMIMSVKMQLSMHLLQMPVIELDQMIQDEIASNPVLEDTTIQSPGQEKAPDINTPASDQFSAPDQRERELDWLDNENIWSSDFFDRSKVTDAIEKHNYQETLLTRSASMQEELLQQLRLFNSENLNLPAAEQIIGNLDENGYLCVSLEEIAKNVGCSQSVAEETLYLVQNLEPAGIAARDLKECLLIQLKRKGKANSPESLIVENFLTELAAKKFKEISKALKLSIDQVKKYAQKIALLDPKPCRVFASAALRIIPDVILEKHPEGYEITINTKGIPELSISQLYQKMLKEKSCTQETMEFIKEKMRSAKDLISGLSQRQQTLEHVTRCIVEHQTDFLEKGISSLTPLTLKEIAAILGLHPSTISRTVANKYIQTPHGTFPLKRFFSQPVNAETGDLSNQKIKSTLDFIVKTEPQEKPYSDQQLVKLLGEKGMKLSRRTVTKYRNALKIPPAHLRKN